MLYLALLVGFLALAAPLAGVVLSLQSVRVLFSNRGGVATWRPGTWVSVTGVSRNGRTPSSAYRAPVERPTVSLPSTAASCATYTVEVTVGARPFLREKTGRLLEETASTPFFLQLGENLVEVVPGQVSLHGKTAKRKYRLHEAPAPLVAFVRAAGKDPARFTMSGKPATFVRVREAWIDLDAPTLVVAKVTTEASGRLILGSAKGTTIVAHGTRGGLATKLGAQAFGCFLLGAGAISAIVMIIASR